MGGRGVSNPRGSRFVVETLDDCYAVAEIRGDEAFRFNFNTKDCFAGSLSTKGATINVNNATEFMWYRKEGKGTLLLANNEF